MSHHRDVNRYLYDLDNEQIVSVGLALGLNYAKLKRMRSLPGDMVAAWLRREDSVLEVGDPMWKVLWVALKDVGQTGLALKIQQEQQGGLIMLFSILHGVRVGLTNNTVLIDDDSVHAFFFTHGIRSLSITKTTSSARL